MTEFMITEDFPKNQREFDQRFCSEQACRSYLFLLRWPNGFSCSKCGCPDYWENARGLYVCHQCGYQQSLTAGTIMHSTNKPLTVWFKAMWWFTTRKSGVNTVNLQDLLGFGCYHTAWRWLQKLRCCTIRRGREKLPGKIEADEFYLGGQKSGKRGRGAENKCAVAIAVERKSDRKLGRLRLQVIGDCSGGELTPFISENVERSSHIQTDGWKGYNGLKKSGYVHDQVIQSKTTDKSSVLPGVHLVGSLLKRLMLGTFQGRFEQKYLQRYLDEYVFRFNRRSTISVGKRFWRIAQQTMSTPPLSFVKLPNGIVATALANWPREYCA